jgi:hypothetical protein
MREAERLRDWMDIFCDWKLQDSQGTWRAYLTETAELAYKGHGKDLGSGPREASRRSPHQCIMLVPGAHALLGWTHCSNCSCRTIVW